MWDLRPLIKGLFVKQNLSHVNNHYHHHLDLHVCYNHKAIYELHPLISMQILLKKYRCFALDLLSKYLLERFHELVLMSQF